MTRYDLNGCASAGCMIWVSIALGGAIGSVLRHAASVVVHRATGQIVPLAVALINIVGCLAIGVLAGLVATGRWSPTYTMRAFVFVGILGGFTTFSSFGLDTFTLVREGKTLLAAANAIGQLTLGVLAVFVGYAAIARL